MGAIHIWKNRRQAKSAEEPNFRFAIFREIYVDDLLEKHPENRYESLIAKLELGFEIESYEEMDWFISEFQNIKSELTGLSENSSAKLNPEYASQILAYLNRAIPAMITEMKSTNFEDYYFTVA